jgi:hypothetical protein
LILRLQVAIGAIIVAEQNGRQVDLKELGWFAFGDVGADHLDLVRGSPRRDAADAMQEIDNRLGALVSDDPLQASHLADEVELLAPVLGDPHMHPGRCDSCDLGQEPGDFRDRVSFKAEPTGRSELNTAVRTDLA